MELWRLNKNNSKKVMKNAPIPKGFLLESPAHFAALGFGTGLSRFAPGTVGTIVGLPLFLLIRNLDLIVQLALLAGLFVLGCHICDVAGKALGVADHGGIVWDEIVAYALVLVTVPQHWGWWLAAFVVFRFFDIIKPAPIDWLDKRFKNGFGVMVDDLMAAAYAIGVLSVIEIMI